MNSNIRDKFKDCLFNKCKVSVLSDNKIILAVSGGADSVCMLILFSEIFDHNRLICAHFNHKIRIKDAQNDADFTESMAHSLGIRFVYGEQKPTTLAQFL